jgi:hypothetical protein
MTQALKIGDKVTSEYVGRTGTVVDIWIYQPVRYDLATKTVVPADEPTKTYYKVRCELLTLDTLQPCIEYRSFPASSLAIVEAA